MELDNWILRKDVGEALGQVCESSHLVKPNKKASLSQGVSKLSCFSGAINAATQRPTCCWEIIPSPLIGNLVFNSNYYLFCALIKPFILASVPDCFNYWCFTLRSGFGRASFTPTLLFNVLYKNIFLTILPN